MFYNAIDLGEKTYIECGSVETPLRTEQDAMDIVTACREHDTSLLMLHADALSDDFIQLSTGLAGQVLQKFINYRIKTAIVIPHTSTIDSKFKELLTESNKGNDVRVLINRIDAENWLIKL